MQIIKPRSEGHYTERRHHFTWKDEPGSGFVFDVDDDDKIVVTEANQENVITALMGVQMGCILDDGIVETEHRYSIPAVGRCSCGAEVQLEGFTNSCDCGADYNWSGQRLAPRSQWGEETGESLGEILRIP